MQLTEFLLARIAEVEQRESSEYQGDRTHYGACFIVERAYGEYGECDCGASADLLADCEVKRRLIELHQQREDGRGCYCCDTVDEPCRVLALLAMPFADHEDYRQEWRRP